MLVSTALSSRNTSRSGATPPIPAASSLGQFAHLYDVITLLLSGLDAALLSRPVQPPQRPTDGPGIDPHAGFRRQVVTAFCQRQVVVRLQQAAQSRLGLVADDRLRAATQPLGRTAAFI